MWFVIKVIILILMLSACAHAAIKQEPAHEIKETSEIWIAFAIGAPRGTLGTGKVEVYTAKGLTRNDAHKKALNQCSQGAVGCFVTAMRLQSQKVCAYVSFGVRYGLPHWVTSASPMRPQQSCMRAFGIQCTRAVSTC
jgi:hypothetical protein